MPRVALLPTPRSAVPYSLFPIPYSLFPTPRSAVPCSLFPLQ
ncbi:hypothetical protein [Moorena producens]